MMDCFDDKSILNFVSGRMSAEAELDGYSHLVECDDCLSRFRDLEFLKENFDSVASSFSPSEHILAYRRMRDAMGTSDEGIPAAASVGEILTIAGEGAVVALRIILDHADRIAGVVAQNLIPGYTQSPQLAVRGVGEPGQTSEIELLIDKADRKLAAGDTNEALEILKEVQKQNPRRVRTAKVECNKDGKLRLQVIADSKKKRIYIYYWPGKDEESPLCAQLISLVEPEKVVSVDFQPLEDDKCILAEFESVSGEYSILIEFPKS